MRESKVLKPGLFAMVEVKPNENWPFVIGSVSDKADSITCELLVDEPRPINVKVGDELTLVCSTEVGVYRFPTKITAIETDPIRLTLAPQRDGATHIQRREFFRLSRPLVRASYRPLLGPEDIFHSELKEAPVKDLSGNGISFIISINEELAAGMPLRTEIELAGGRIVNLVGEVVRCLTNEPVMGKSLLCVHFSLIEECDRDRIIGQLFREQLDRAGRRRRLSRRN
ncbi:MAG TPA: PilZ domain-containing protein [Candidatus Aquicultor sp.]|jgi:c-di-GMP-binding flagellar brake protein YcgR